MCSSDLWPADLDELGYDCTVENAGANNFGDGCTGPSGKYVDDVEVQNGTIVIAYGGQANTAITGAEHVVAIQPFVGENLDVVWRCGTAAAPANALATHPNDAVASVGSDGLTDILGKYLPSTCRGAAAAPAP